ncbi:MAG: ATP-binding protein [Treponema sp.]|nr:ATP-binding protein [Treponema sp.]MCL2271892.1 ATP-binding protein [Treponema sp.]
MGNKTKTKFKLTPVHIKIFTVIICIVVIINVCSIAAGALFLTGDTNEIESLKSRIPYSILIIGVMALALSIAAAFIAAILLKRPYDEAENMRRDAEAMSLSKSVFLANVSHEIRTPMNSIVGFSELALDGETSFKTKDYLNKIQTNAQWLLQIINDILDISKVESGKLDIENIPFDMHELFSSCRTLIMPKAVEKGISLYFYVEPSIGKKPLGDPTRLRQVLVNLLSNAVKFTNTGMVKLQAVLKNMRDKTITMYFEVKDSGIGMTPEQIKKIFDPFVQAETDTTRKYGGTGLGLTITKTIVELMGGTLSVESTYGVGSKFSFELTFDTININDEEMFERKIVLNELKKPRFEGEVLLCEDNVMNQQVICEHLSRVGLKTVVAENGKIGLDLVKSRHDNKEKMFDLIFMDMHMPVMDGLEASTKIMEINKDIPVVAMTANIMATDREIYKMSGMYDCLGKPFTSQELWRCLMKYFTPITTGISQKNSTLETDIEFQKSLQSLFVRNNHTKYAEIINAIEEGDIQLAHRMAHSLKSNAGQIGKTILQRAAAVVEANLKEGKNKVTHEHLKHLETELTMVLNEFSPMLREAGDFSDFGGSIAQLELFNLFEKLGILLKSGNPECRSLKSNLRLLPVDNELKNILIQQMDDFDFTAAFLTLEKIKEGIK